MNSFWDTVLATPFHYLGMLLAFFAAFAFLIFLRGFLGGIGNIFKMNGHEEHLEHAYARQVWGVYLLFFLFALWEVLRTVASWLGYQTGDTSIGIYIAVIVAVCWLFLFIKRNLFSGGGGGH